MIYHNRIVKPVFEFLLWDNCSNNCKFCYQKLHYNKFTFEQRKQSVQLVKQFINSDDFINNSHVLLVGGELFDDIANYNLLVDMAVFISDKMLNHCIDLLYINTNLIYSDLQMLYEFLNVFQENGLIQNIKFTSSYDIYGRYENNASNMLFLQNLQHVKQQFKYLNIVVNSILTKQMCEAILNNTFSVRKFCNTYNVKINTIPYINFNNELLASRHVIFNTLSHINKENPGFLESYIYDMDIKQEKRLYVYKNNTLNYESSALNTCGHSINFAKYSLDNTCFVCDLKRLFL